MTARPLATYLTRLIVLAMLPLLVVTVWIAVDQRHDRRTEMAQEAERHLGDSAARIDGFLEARILALHMLAASTLVDDPLRWPELYAEAMVFRDSFGSHVIFADADGRMLFNTRAPFGTPLPALPLPEGQAAVPRALATGMPAVGDIFQGPVIDESLVAIAVPRVRDGIAAHLMLVTTTAREFQQRIDEISLQPGWALTVSDSNGQVIARRAPQDFDPDREVAADSRFETASTLAPWSIELEIPRHVQQKPVIQTALSLSVAILAAILISVLASARAARHLGRQVATLTDPTRRGPSDILEIADARRRIDETATHLNRTQARFAATFEQAAVGIALVAPDGRWLRVNRRLREMLGYSEAELRLVGFADITHPDDRNADLEFVRRMLSGDIARYSLEKRYLRKDGIPIWANLSVTLVRKADRSADYFVSIVADIGQRKRAEAALRDSEARHRELFDVNPHPMWVYDLATLAFLAVNDAAIRHYGYSREEFLLMTIKDIRPPEDVPRLMANVREVTEGIDEAGIWRHFTRDGRLIDVEICSHALFFEGRRAELVLAHDVTLRRQSEQAVRDLNLTLEARVAERTAELTAANAELESFGYAVSHDLRAPLRAMNGFAHALLEDHAPQLDAEARTYLEQITLASRRMSALIDGILTLSRSTRGALVRSEVDLSLLAERRLSELARDEPQRRVRYEIEPGLKVDGDARMLDVVMTNLLDNAWKYTGTTSEPLIRVGFEARDGRQWITVADNGAGFDMAFAQRLFQPFQRLHRQDEFPGVGIGLATVQRIVHRHGGTIDATAIPGGGAVFRFTLPAGSHAEVTA